MNAKLFVPSFNHIFFQARIVVKVILEVLWSHGILLVILGTKLVWSVMALENVELGSQESIPG